MFLMFLGLIAMAVTVGAFLRWCCHRAVRVNGVTHLGSQRQCPNQSLRRSRSPCEGIGRRFAPGLADVCTCTATARDFNVSQQTRSTKSNFASGAMSIILEETGGDVWMKRCWLAKSQDAFLTC